MAYMTRPEGENEILFTLLAPQLESVSEKINKQPECRLMWAVLQSAIDTYIKYAYAKRPRHQNRFREVKEWIEQDDPSWLFSFVNICYVLGLDPHYIRAGLKRLIEERGKELQEAA